MKEVQIKNRYYVKTGWFKGKDGKWRFEIDDSKLQYRYAGETGKLAEYIRHDELFANYPKLRKVNVKFADLPKRKRGSFSPWDNTIRLSNKLKENPVRTLIHEIQHAIQWIERFEHGGNIKEALKTVRKQAGKYLAANDPKYRVMKKNAQQRKQYIDNYIKRMYNADTIEEAGYQAYRDLYVEQEARRTAERLPLRAEERRRSYPEIGERSVLRSETKRKHLGKN